MWIEGTGREKRSEPATRSGLDDETAASHSQDMSGTLQGAYALVWAHRADEFRDYHHVEPPLREGRGSEWSNFYVYERPSGGGGPRDRFGVRLIRHQYCRFTAESSRRGQLGNELGGMRADLEHSIPELDSGHRDPKVLVSLDFLEYGH